MRVNVFFVLLCKLTVDFEKCAKYVQPELQKV